MYLPARLIENITAFLRHWYFDSFLNTSHFMLNVFEEMDRIFALKINFRNLLKPLYQDATVIGYLLGFVFRFFRVVVASAVYLVVFLISVVFYLTWLAIPIYVVYMISGHAR